MKLKYILTFLVGTIGIVIAIEVIILFKIEVTNFSTVTYSYVDILSSVNCNFIVGGQGLTIESAMLKNSFPYYPLLLLE